MLASLTLCLLPTALAVEPAASEPPVVELTGLAVLPADTFAPGPGAGARLAPTRGTEPPFLTQPVQGISALARRADGRFLALSDNGFGAPENSFDYELCWYVLALEGGEGGARGRVAIWDRVLLTDPNGLLRFPLARPLDRVLTGADLDPESLAIGPDGSVWIGEEFGPFLLRFSSEGVLLEPPYGPNLPDGRALRSPHNPFLERDALRRHLEHLLGHGQGVGSDGVVALAPHHGLLDANGLASAPLPNRTDRALPPHLPAAPSEFVDLRGLQRAGFSVVPYTVNDAVRMGQLLDAGVNGLITDAPDRLLELLRERARVAGSPLARAFLPDGTLDRAVFDLQGHRGARELAPENTLPSMERALDFLATTLEFDYGISADGVAVLCHEPEFLPAKVRLATGELLEQPLPLGAWDHGRIQRELAADLCLSEWERQSARPGDYPVAEAFRWARRWPSLFAPPTVLDVIEFADFYANWYQHGPGASHPEAKARSANAARVVFHPEAKRTPQDPARTPSPEVFVDALARVLAEPGPTRAARAGRVRVQSFDLAVLLEVQRRLPNVGVTLLVGDFPEGGDSARRAGTNLEDRGGLGSPWFAGLPWPYRRSLDPNAPHAQPSGGFEGLALSADGRQLLLALEKPLVGELDRVRLFAFDLLERRFVAAHTYSLSDPSHAIGALASLEDGSYLVLERDQKELAEAGYKRIYRFDPAAPQQPKRLVADLLQIRDGSGYASSYPAGAFGVGERFAMPFLTLESLVVVGPRELWVANDNNYPFSPARLGPGPQDTEFVRLRLATDLW